MARVLNLILIALEIRGLSLSNISKRKWLIFAFYTQLSNMLATLSSVLLVIVGQPAWITTLRYLCVCMLVMTAMVTIFVLVPMGGDPHWLLWSGNGLYHHVLCPALATISYVFFEAHAPRSTLLLPVVVTLAYGLILIWLNYIRVVDGPYPFFKVHEQSWLATVLWVLVLLAVVTAISFGVLVIAP